MMGVMWWWSAYVAVEARLEAQLLHLIKYHTHRAQITLWLADQICIMPRSKLKYGNGLELH
jgi:hypothetical protein